MVVETYKAGHRYGHWELSLVLMDKKKCPTVSHFHWQQTLERQSCLHEHQNTCHGYTYWQGHWCPWRVPSTALPWHPRTRLGHQPLPDLPAHSAQAGCHGLGMPLSNFVLQLKLSQPCVAFLLPLPLLSASGWRGELEAQKVKIRWEQVSWGKNSLLEMAMR